METPPNITVKGKLGDLVPVLAYTISEIIDVIVDEGMKRPEAERAMVIATQSAILASRIVSEEEKRKGEQDAEGSNDI